MERENWAANIILSIQDARMLQQMEEDIQDGTSTAPFILPPGQGEDEENLDA
jgi:hypothetical protein